MLYTSDLQYGFKPDHSTTQCTFVVQEITELYTRNNSAFYTVLLDASQAFDSVKYNKLFDLLCKRNMCSGMLRLLINIYTSQTLSGQVVWGII
jgi:hypothetical protein